MASGRSDGHAGLEGSFGRQPGGRALACCRLRCHFPSRKKCHTAVRRHTFKVRARAHLLHLTLEARSLLGAEHQAHAVAIPSKASQRVEDRERALHLNGYQEQRRARACRACAHAMQAWRHGAAPHLVVCWASSSGVSSAGAARRHTSNVWGARGAPACWRMTWMLPARPGARAGGGSAPICLVWMRSELAHSSVQCCTVHTRVCSAVQCMYVRPGPRRSHCNSLEHRRRPSP